MNLIQQNPSPAIDFSGLKADDLAGSLAVSGVVLMHGAEYPVDATFDPVDAPAVYVQADGVVTADGANAFAHLAWHDGEAWNVITHPTPEPIVEVEPEPEAPADLPDENETDSEPLAE